MRIGIITTKLNFETSGGSVMDIHFKAKGLVGLGHNVTVVTVFSLANNVTIKTPYQIREEYFKSRGLVGIQLAVYRTIRKHEKDFDVIYIDGHTFLYGAGMYRLISGQLPIVGFFGLRLNAWVDTPKSAKDYLRLWIERWFGVPLVNHIDAFIFSTPMIKKMYNDFGIGCRQSVVIENFVETDKLSKRYNVTAESHTEKLNKNPKIILLASGRMITEKGFNILIEAVNLLSHKEKYKVVLCGNGPEANKLKELVHSLKLDNLIEFPGWVQKGTLYSYLNSANIFIFPSGRAEYGSVLLTEAMAFALPIIVPTGGALEWLTAGGANTFKPNDPSDLARCIELIAKDTKLQTKLSQKILSRALELDYKNLTKKLEATITEIARPLFS